VKPTAASPAIPLRATAAGTTGKRRVVPHDANDSLIVQKLEGKDPAHAPVCGAQMPFELPPICDNVVRGIRAWITKGAPDD
jgi:hypothetical protein